MPYSSPVIEALDRLARRQQGPLRLAQPVAIVGPREATPEQEAVAYRLALALAGAGLTLVCGGKIGVMQAAARGARDAGGICVGLLPEEEAAHGNPFLTVALPTGIGLSRNMLVARSAACLVAVGGGLGTLSEIAMALQWKKPVFATAQAPHVAGAQYYDDEETLLLDALAWLARFSPQQAADLGG
ncbi:TIGR00725 family protein [Laribacter hongkongensis]|jgi:uncharacterized protein (TIGR00725 family)|uniref:Lysine decarboxylase family protein n=2 Tax=Laribacter hongkongensis TaxID=168471 RepID=C1DBD0_LARHH|nr:TIGR00725 family protein [Laribacter hongkongensis]ACO73327.1 Lysine decarboxylase family protein [Laribacter hongkongensis HLHK9]ASJ23163.1 lysine decarboxylase [Laribacter hongkongensis]MCG8991606.1 TIGR00725 family protein [Laribacter hongkongensis]MCG8996667.1 TIGR00725 family protein [Laribacter hongkongensis]MCG8996874.1 TIGR00725 family protein [Laribacter hongkongensis]